MSATSLKCFRPIVEIMSWWAKIKMSWFFQHSSITVVLINTRITYTVTMLQRLQLLTFIGKLTCCILGFVCLFVFVFVFVLFCFVLFLLLFLCCVVLCCVFFFFFFFFLINTFSIKLSYSAKYWTLISRCQTQPKRTNVWQLTPKYLTKGCVNKLKLL